jgi:hypothetical protein
MVERRFDRMRTKRTGKRKKTSKGSGDAISVYSRKMLDHSVANLKKGLASAPIVKTKRRVRLGALKGWIKIQGDIIHSDMEDDWEVG